MNPFFLTFSTNTLEASFDRWMVERWFRVADVLSLLFGILARVLGLWPLCGEIWRQPVRVLWLYWPPCAWLAWSVLDLAMRSRVDNDRLTKWRIPSALCSRWVVIDRYGWGYRRPDFRGQKADPPVQPAGRLRERATLAVLCEGWRALNLDGDVRSQQFGDGLEWWQQTGSGEGSRRAPFRSKLAGSVSRGANTQVV